MNNVISNYGRYLRTFSTCSYIGCSSTLFLIRDYTRRRAKSKSTFSNSPVVRPKFVNSLSLSRAPSNLQYHTFNKQYVFSDLVRRIY